MIAVKTEFQEFEVIFSTEPILELKGSVQHVQKGHPTLVNLILKN